MNTVTTTLAGDVRGEARGGHVIFRGIPFAEPPVSERRFAAPEPAQSWTGTRECLAFGPAAPQTRAAVGWMEAGRERSEDCLYLNVYTPACDGGERPVMFWIHGGGFTTGSGSQALYDAGRLCERGDVVVVTINYRLGALGYCDVGSQGGDAWGAVANAGQRDQIAALQWVRDNALAFGGNPHDVTIFGESAGSVAVATLLAMPAAGGLFHKAICQSGTANRVGNRESAAAAAADLIEKCGLADATALRDAPVETVLAAQAELAAMRGGFFPIVDDDSLPMRPINAIRKGAARDIPLLIGTNRDEQRLWMNPKREAIDEATLQRRVAALLPARTRDRAEEVVAAYRASRQQRDLRHDNNDLVDAVTTDSAFRIPSTRLAEAQSEQQPNTFLYLFDWESPAYRGTMGACHALEIPFVFGHVDSPMLGRWVGASPAAERLSDQMMSAWIAFARTGDPNHSGIETWPQHEPERRATMIFGERTRAEDAPFEEERALWQSLLGT